MHQYAVVKSTYSRVPVKRVRVRVRTTPYVVLSTSACVALALMVSSSMSTGEVEDISHRQAAPVPGISSTMIEEMSGSIINYIPTPTPVQEAEVQVKQGNMLDNALYIVDFLMNDFSSELDWLKANYKPSWPYGEPCEANPRRNFSAAMAIGIAANAVRESSANPSAIQGGGAPSYSNASGCALGLFQVDGGIRHNYLKFADSLGMPYDDIDTQLHFLAYSYYSTGAGFYVRWQGKLARNMDTVLSRSNAHAAAEAFRADWEVGGYQGVAEEILDTWHNKWDASWGQKPDGGLYSYCVANLNLKEGTVNGR